MLTLGMPVYIRASIPADQIPSILAGLKKVFFLLKFAVKVGGRVIHEADGVRHVLL